MSDFRELYSPQFDCNQEMPNEQNNVLNARELRAAESSSTQNRPTSFPVNSFPQYVSGAQGGIAANWSPYFVDGWSHNEIMMPRIPGFQFMPPQQPPRHQVGGEAMFQRNYSSDRNWVNLHHHQRNADFAAASKPKVFIQKMNQMQQRPRQISNAYSTPGNRNTHYHSPQPKKFWCALCKSNNEPKEVYTTHMLKDVYGNVVCPILRSLTCEICGATGSNAHTKHHCPHQRKNKNEVPPAVALKNTLCDSTGRIRRKLKF